jgi:riboflavin biosynthesis pyrimidine reductase
MCADILSEADALVDLPVALEKLEDGILASLAEGGSMLFKELIESFLFSRDLLLK